MKRLDRPLKEVSNIPNNVDDCNEIHIRQTKRHTTTKFTEYVKETGYGERHGATTVRSALATHSLETRYLESKDNLELARRNK